MAARPTLLTSQLYDYYQQTFLRENPSLKALRGETAAFRYGYMHSCPEQAQFIAMLLKILDAKTVLEIGTFTGYGSLAMAMALPAEGTLITCDLPGPWLDTAQLFWQKAGVKNIQLRIQDASLTLAALMEEGYAGSFDFIFIDADKINYDFYYEQSLRLIRPQGIIGIDNVFWFGKVADPTKKGQETQAIQALNQKLSQDSRIDLTVIPFGDGLALAKKISQLCR